MHQTMKTCVSSVSLWMLFCVVNAEMNNFAATLTIPDITTPLAELVSRRPSGGEGATGDRSRRGRPTLIRPLGTLDESLTLFGQGLHLLHENLNMQQEALSKLEQRLDTLEKLLVPLEIGKGDAVVGVHESITQMMSRLDTLEAKFKKTMEGKFPNLEERFSSSEDSSAVSFSATAPSIFMSSMPSSSHSVSTLTTPSYLSFPFPSTLSPNYDSSSHSTSLAASNSPSPSPTISTSISDSNPHSSFPPASPRPTAASDEELTHSASLAASTSPSPSPTISTSISDSNPHSSFPPASPRPTAASDEELARRQVELRVREVRQRIARAEAAPSPLEEQLLRASSNGWVEEVRELLDAGADVNSTDTDGLCPLLKGIRGAENNEPVVSLLLERGADVNAIDIHARSALHLAAGADNSGRLVTLLLREGGRVDLDARNEHGMTPLHVAASRNDEAAVRALVAAGADKRLRGWSGRWSQQTPFDVAWSDAVRDLLRT